MVADIHSNLEALKAVLKDDKMKMRWAARLKSPEELSKKKINIFWENCKNKKIARSSFSSLISQKSINWIYFWK